MRLVVPLVVLCLFAAHAEAQSAFAGKIEVSAPAPEKVGKPQKTISYPLVVENVGPVRARVVFELVEGPGGDWNVLVPSSVVLEPGQSAASTVVVATPYDAGYNDGSARFVLRATPTSPDDPTSKGEPQDIQLGATVKGWYAPGPSAVLLLAALGLVASVRRAKD